MKRDEEELDETKVQTGKLIVQKLAEEIFTVDGTPTVTRKENDQYRKKPLVAGAEFMLTDAYVGKRHNLIFIFTPADGQDYTIEIEPRHVDDIFLDFGGVLGKAFDIASERTEYIVKQLVNQEIKRRQQAEEERRKEQQRKTAEIYANNPNFGRF